jgi:mannose-6-phosphate isomerase-like protein (cupin superfamily)
VGTINPSQAKEAHMRTPNYAVLTISFLAALLTAPAVIAEHEHVLLNEADIQWGEAPPLIPPGAKAAILQGNPSEKDLFTIRLRLPANYKIPAHWHPRDEHVVVLSGALYMGMGDKLDTSAGKAVKVGGFALVPAKKPHYAYTKEATTIQVYGIGPVEFTYVNPDDDPRKSDKK